MMLTLHGSKFSTLWFGPNNFESLTFGIRLHWLYVMPLKNVWWILKQIVGRAAHFTAEELMIVMRTQIKLDAG